MKITVVLDVPKLKSRRDSEEFAASLADHIVETFNDDTSIKSIKTSYIINRKGNA